ncbi:glycosyltransferase family 4 protein [Thalassotalea euphylliae]|uniref:glycosyltransferase family 4 protein n=1 Tax=Thalassotalea euphylliae TaxID=1655234 RepID=UPI003634C13F
MKKILYVTAVPETVNAFLTSYLNALNKHYDVHVLTSHSEKQLNNLADTITVHNIDIARKPSVAKDLKSLFALYRFLRKHNFDMVHSFTPKAGLITQLASFFAGVKYRFHTFTGQVWATKQGAGRTLLKTLDKVTATLCTACLADSGSQKAFIVGEGVVKDSKCTVLANGSISGINLSRFQHDPQARQTLRAEHGIGDDEFVFLFVGRLNREKGIPELFQAFNQLSSDRKFSLFVIGSDEEALASLAADNDNIHYLGFKSNVPEYCSFADTLVLPSHREGFGNVIIEAAACGIPSIASNIYGLSDAVADNYSGLLHEVKNADDLRKCMQMLLDDPTLYEQLKNQAKSRAESEFDEQVLVNALLDYYNIKFRQRES